MRRIPCLAVIASIGTASFHDLTSSVTSGSVRVRGQAGGFSEFVIVKNSSQNYLTDADTTYDALDTRLADPGIGLTAQLTLQTDLSPSRAASSARSLCRPSLQRPTMAPTSIAG